MGRQSKSKTPHTVYAITLHSSYPFTPSPTCGCGSPHYRDSFLPHVKMPPKPQGRGAGQRDTGRGSRTGTSVAGRLPCRCWPAGTPSINQAVSQSINQSVNQSVSQSVSQSVNQSVNPYSHHPPTHLSTHASKKTSNTHPPTHQATHPSTRICTYPSTHSFTVHCSMKQSSTDTGKKRNNIYHFLFTSSTNPNCIQ